MACTMCDALSFFSPHILILIYLPSILHISLPTFLFFIHPPSHISIFTRNNFHSVGTNLGVSESIAIKSSQNIIRYSTFTNNNNAMIEFVSGDYNVAYGNWFIGAGGFSIADSNDVYIYNNYFQSAGMSTDMEYPRYTITNPITFAGTSTAETSSATSEDGQGAEESSYSSKCKASPPYVQSTSCHYIQPLTLHTTSDTRQHTHPYSHIVFFEM